MSKFYRKSIIVEEAPAWEECSACLETGKVEIPNGSIQACKHCGGRGGVWHEAVTVIPASMAFGLLRGDLIRHFATLIREHEVCQECNGTCIEGSSMDNSRRECTRCLKDADGEPTGAEPGTAGEWKVKG